MPSICRLLRVVIFTILILSIQEHSIFSIVSSLISFISVLFSAYLSFASMGRFIPRYFILSVAVVSGIVSLSSLSDFLLFVYQNARDFYILFLCPATLLNFLCTVLGFPGGSDRLKKKKMPAMQVTRV